jgi:excisionase family DNA binding protein
VTPPDRTYSPEEVAQIVGLHRQVVYRAIREGELRAYKVRGRLRIEAAEFEAWFRREPAETAATRADRPLAHPLNRASLRLVRDASLEGR